MPFSPPWSPVKKSVKELKKKKKASTETNEKWRGDSSKVNCRRCRQTALEAVKLRESGNTLGCGGAQSSSSAEDWSSYHKGARTQESQKWTELRGSSYQGQGWKQEVLMQSLYRASKIPETLSLLTFLYIQGRRLGQPSWNNETAD